MYRIACGRTKTLTRRVRSYHWCEKRTNYCGQSRCSCPSALSPPPPRPLSLPPFNTCSILFTAGDNSHPVRAIGDHEIPVSAITLLPRRRLTNPNYISLGTVMFRGPLFSNRDGRRSKNEILPILYRVLRSNNSTLISTTNFLDQSFSY